MSTQDFMPLHEIEAALSYISSDDRQTWITVSFILADEYGDAAGNTFINWSSKSPSYDERDAEKKWRQALRHNPSGKAAGIGTIIHMAKQNGWVRGKSDPIPEDVIEKHRQAREARLKAQEEKLKQEREAAILSAGKIIDSTVACPSDHAYLQAKGISLPDLRMAPKAKLDLFDDETGEIKQRTVSNVIVIPIRQATSRLSSLQLIDESGKKYYLYGGEKKAGYYPIGKFTKEAEKVVVCEGWATGVSIHMATGYPVVVAFDAGNLESVALKIKKAIPNAEFIIAADNDQFTKAQDGSPWNPGVESATKAAKAVSGRVAIPQFSNIESKPTDFNDLHMLQGLSAVLEQINTIPSQELSVPSKPADIADLEFEDRYVDTMSTLPDVKKNGQPIETIENLQEILQRLNVTVRYNVIKKDDEILIPGQAFSKDNRANASFAWIKSWVKRFGMSTESLTGYIRYLAEKNKYNPVIEWINSKPWDGISRVNDFYATITTANGEDELKNIMIKRWMVTAVAAAFNPNGVSAGGILVLNGPQYLGKTKWFKSLVPADLDLIAEGRALQPDNRDSVEQVITSWIVELGELDGTFRKADVAALKAFITRDSDTIRKAYDAKPSTYARRTVLFASVNPREFLHDKTGNRRYWTIECANINHSHDLDMQQVWAEFYEQYYLKGESIYLQPEEIAALNDHNTDFETIDPVEERISSSFAWKSDPSLWRWLSATEALLEAGFINPSKSDATAAGHFIAKLNGNKRTRIGNSRKLLVPPKL